MNKPSIDFAPETRTHITSTTTELQHLETALELEHYLLMTGYSTPENYAGATAAIRSRIEALENSGESLEDA